MGWVEYNKVHFVFYTQNPFLVHYSEARRAKDGGLRKSETPKFNKSE